jgi:hypothetical protein
VAVWGVEVVVVVTCHLSLQTVEPGAGVMEVVVRHVLDDLAEMDGVRGRKSRSEVSNIAG